MPAVGRSVAWLASATALSLLIGPSLADELADALGAPLTATSTAVVALPVAAVTTAATVATAAALVIPAPISPPLATGATPKIAIIIDDLGYRLADGLRAARLPGPVAVAILPRTPHAATLAREADEHGKEIVLHVPMQALETDEPLGPGALELYQTRAELTRALADDLAAVPLARAVSNHMGSSLTREAAPMRWVMEELKARGPLLFIDSYTTAESVALRVARETGVPALRRDVFLDGDQSPESIEREWLRLLARARERGVALAIGHPHSATLDLLERVLPQIEDEGIELVTLADLLAASRTAEAWAR